MRRSLRTTRQADSTDSAASAVELPVLSAESSQTRGNVARALIEMTKPGIVRMVGLTAMIGFTLSAIGSSWAFAGLALAASACLVGTCLCAAGANVLNQVLEAPRDARMDRTKDRPIPSGRLSARAATAWGLGLTVSGLAVLAVLANPAAALVAGVTSASYLLVYTPSKVRTTWSTVIGAVPGALPPMIGWAAGAQHAGADASAGWASLTQPGGWSIFAIMFVWQMPHFLAIAWKYRADYAAGGFRVLPVIDPGGERTARHVVVWSVVLIAVGMVPAFAMPGRVSALSAVAAGVLGAALLGYALRLAEGRGERDARALFFASIVYLPVMLLVVTGDALRSAL